MPGIGEVRQRQQNDAVAHGRQACAAGQKADPQPAADEIAQRDGIVALGHNVGSEVHLVAGFLDDTGPGTVPPEADERLLPDVRQGDAALPGQGMVRRNGQHGVLLYQQAGAPGQDLVSCNGVEKHVVFRLLRVLEHPLDDLKADVRPDAAEIQQQLGNEGRGGVDAQADTGFSFTFLCGDLIFGVLDGGEDLPGIAQQNAAVLFEMHPPAAAAPSSFSRF